MLLESEHPTAHVFVFVARSLSLCLSVSLSLSTPNTVKFRTECAQGYHAGVIGRVNDDGSLYVKLNDGDAEWSVPVKHVILSYAYAPPTAPPAEGMGTPVANTENVNGRKLAHAPRAGIGENDVVQQAPPSPVSHKSNSASTNAEDRPRTDSNIYLPASSRAAVTISPVLDDIDGIRQAASGSVEAAEVPNSMSQLEAPPISAPAINDTTPGNGLGWIAEVANSVGSPASSVTGLPRGAGGAGDRSPVPKSAFSPFAAATPGATQIPLAGTIGASSPRASAAHPVPRPLTPTHLEWKPIKDGSAQRRWGAPPPDNAASEGQEDNAPPSRRLSASALAPINTAGGNTATGPKGDNGNGKGDASATDEPITCDGVSTITSNANLAMESNDQVIGENRVPGDTGRTREKRESPGEEDSGERRRSQDRELVTNPQPQNVTCTKESDVKTTGAISPVTCKVNDSKRDSQSTLPSVSNGTTTEGAGGELGAENNANGGEDERALWERVRTSVQSR